MLIISPCRDDAGVHLRNHVVVVVAVVVFVSLLQSFVLCGCYLGSPGGLGTIGDVKHTFGNYLKGLCVDFVFLFACVCVWIFVCVDFVCVDFVSVLCVWSCLRRSCNQQRTNDY